MGLMAQAPRRRVQYTASVRLRCCMISAPASKCCLRAYRDIYSL
jgi:hypothetical protein